MRDSTAKLSLGQRLGYGVGDLGQTLFFQATMLYLMYFYTDIAGIAPASVAVILLGARSLDAMSDPVIGMLADRTRTRWGRFRPYLLFGAIPLAATAFATFSTIPGSASQKEAFAIVTYVAFSICFSAVAIPYSALLGVICDDPKDRSALGTLRAGFSFTAGIIVAYATLPVVQLAGGGKTGFHVALIGFGVVGIALVWTAFATTRETTSSRRHDTPGIRETIRCVGTIPLVLFVLVFFLTNIATMLRSAGAIYYFKYTLGRESLVSDFLSFGAVMTVVGIAVTPLLSRRLGHRGVMIIGNVMMTVGYLATSFLPASVSSTFVWLGGFTYFGLGLGAATTWPILADCVDYTHWRRGTRVDGIVYGFAIFSQKVSLALGGSVSGLMLSATGYVANTRQTEEALRGILALVGSIPAGCMVVATVLGILYPLTSSRVAEIRTALHGRGLQAVEP